MGYNFQEDLKKAEVSEMKFYEYCIEKGFEIEDVRHDKRFQDVDVDFLVKNSQGKYIEIEVKSDDGIAKYGNILLEEISNRYINSDGWWRKTQAKLLLFYMPQNGYYYKFKTKDIKDYLRTGQYQIKNVFNSECKLFNIDKFCRWKGCSKNDLIFMQ